MKTNRHKNKIGLIYTPAQLFRNDRTSTDKAPGRQQAGSIRGTTPRRHSSVGKIITRPCTPKKMLSIEIQTAEMIPIMEAKGVQVEGMLMAKQEVDRDRESQRERDRGKADGLMDSTIRNNKNKVGFLKMADFNVLSEEAEVLSKTIRKKCENLYRKDSRESRYTKENKQNGGFKEQPDPPRNQKYSEPVSLQSRQVRPGQPPQNKQARRQPLGIRDPHRQSTRQGDRGNRQEKISKLSALYEKNLARYETSKTALVDLLKQNKAK